MRLSEAIRLGAMMKPQAFGSTRGARVASAPRTCALAAAAEAVGDECLSVFHPRWLARWPVSLRLKWCPVCPPDKVMLCECVAVIAHLNDKHRWTRERIADWVATLEPDETTAAQTTTAHPRGSHVLQTTTG